MRSLEQATAIAHANGVTIPSWIRIEVDPSIREAKSFAEYRLGPEDLTATTMVEWADLTSEGAVVVRVHPSVLRSDEKLVGVLQHEVWVLTELRSRIEAKGSLPATEIQRLIESSGASNLHGQAWDIADLRVLIMRTGDPAEKARLTDRLAHLTDEYKRANIR